MNKVNIVIENCKDCPCATLKFNKKAQDDIMYCQSLQSLIMLRTGWGAREIPDWCPLLNKEEKE